MNSLQFTTIINTLASFIVENEGEESAEILAAAFTQLGDTITTILTFNSLPESKQIKER